MQIVGDKDLYGEDYIVELKNLKPLQSLPIQGILAQTLLLLVLRPKHRCSGGICTNCSIWYSPAYVPYHPPFY